MNLIKNYSKLFLLACLIVFFLLSCSQGQEEEKKESITVSEKTKLRISTFLTAIDYAPYVIAKKKGWFNSELEKLNVEVEHLDPFQSPPPINEALATKQIEAVFTAEVPTIIGKAAGIDVVIPWISATLNSEIITPINSKVKSLNDLIGKPVACLAGTAPHYGFVKNLKKNNINVNDIEFIDMFPPDAKAAFETGQIMAWAIWPPFVEMELIAGKGRVIENVISPVQVVLAMRGDFVSKYPKITNALINILQKSKRWILSNQDESIDIMSKELNLPIEVVRLAWPKIIWDVSVSNEEIIKDIQEKADFIHEIGFIKRGVNVKEELFVK